jgi:hypothetical protein
MTVNKTVRQEPNERLVRSARMREQLDIIPPAPKLDKLGSRTVDQNANMQRGKAAGTCDCIKGDEDPCSRSYITRLNIYTFFTSLKTNINSI